MNVLVVATFAFPDHFGGAERVITEVASRLVERGHAVRLLTGRTEGTPARETRDGVDVQRYPVEPGSPARFWRSVWSGVRRALRDGAAAQADVVHLHQVASAVPALAPGGLGGRPTVLTFHAPYHLEYLARFRDGRASGDAPVRARAAGATLRQADRYVVRRSREILVLSDFARRQVLDLDAGAARRTGVAPAGVDRGRFRPSRDEHERRAERRACGLPDDDLPLLLTVRRLVPRMGVADLVEACARLPAGTPWRLAVAGSGSERQALDAAVARLGLGDRVHFLGFLPDDRLPALYRAADVFVLPTRSLEGFGMATVEALASGLPVVATRAGASADVLAPVDGARLVPPADPAALSAALAPLLTDAGRRREISVAARRHADEHLGWSRHLDAFEGAARRAVERRR